MKAAVVGAGIMGRLMALRLIEQGWSVTLFDENELINAPANCSQIAAGLLAPVSELDKAEPIIFKLGVESLTSCWPKILRRLASPIYFKQNGCLVLHHPQDVAEWHNFSSHICKKLGSDFYQTLTQDDLMQLEPELCQFSNGYFIVDEAHIDSQAVLSELGTYLYNQNIIWNSGVQVSVVLPGCVVAKGQSYSFDMVFDCRGLGAKSSAPELRGMRGELIWLLAPDVQIQRPVRLLHPRYSLYLVPRPNKHYLIGASELETEDYSPISVRTTLELLTAAYYLHAGFAEARVIKTSTHCRPCLPSHQPRINYTEGLVSVNGLYRHGYLIAPALAEEVMRGINSRQQHLNYPELWEVYSGQHLPKQSANLY